MSELNGDSNIIFKNKITTNAEILFLFHNVKLFRTNEIFARHISTI